MKDRDDVHELTRLISIDHIDGKTVHAYANKKQFTDFLQYTDDFRVLPHPGSLLQESQLNPSGASGAPGDRTTWNFYPTYTQYLSFMAGFQASYPSLCKIDTVGLTYQGRLILTARISQNVGTEEAEPQFLYTSSIHGDELTGYVLMLHLIDHLLSNYNIDSAITQMINTTEICINPLANPDGTFHGGNNSVSGATRYNALGVDLNRNYPDPQNGPHPDGNDYQVETVAWMDYAAENHFTMSANFHGGAEVFNYPWDTWATLPADDNWWNFVGREWADTVHKYSPSGYFTDERNGVTSGYAWYEVNGGRQDYMNYWHNCREVTLEISNIKTPLASQLPSFWEYNYRSFLNYIRQSRYGFNGIVTDTVTDTPVAAKVFIQGHDVHNSEVFSRDVTGFYARPIYAGSYDVTFSSPGYFTKTIPDVNVTKRNTTRLDVQLRPLTFDAQDRSVVAHMIFPNPSDGRFRIMLPEIPIKQMCSFQVINTMGTIVHSSALERSGDNMTAAIDLPDLANGLYFIRFNSGYRIYVDKLVIKK